MTFTPSPDLIDRDLAMRAHSGTSWTPEERGEQEIAIFVQDVTSIHGNLMEASMTDAERQIIDEEMKEFQERYARKWNDKLAAKSRCLSLDRRNSRPIAL
jgi:hypothetical protein